MNPAERIRSRDRLIIERGGVYLAGARNGQPLWHWSKYHAWWDENHNGRFVEKVAEKVGGTVMIFNPITGSARKKGQNDNEENAGMPGKNAGNPGGGCVGRND